MTTERALEIAIAAHAGQKRKNTGEDYITHPIAVADIAVEEFKASYHWQYFKSDPDSIIRKIRMVALLHDVVEDTNLTIDELTKEFPDIHILSALNLLTRKKSQTYYEFIMNIKMKGNVIAQIVKIADLIHNSSDLAEGSLKDKYRFALHILKQN